jgi:hypothetical protein
MDEEWLTYEAVGDRLAISPSAARSLARRRGWRRQLDNSGRALVFAAIEPRPPDDQPADARSSAGRRAVDPALAAALESHIKTLQGEIETLKEQLSAAEARAAAELAAAEARAEKLEMAEAERVAEIKAERDRLEAQLRGEADRLTAERERADKAIAAFASLADRLDALAAERRPWWRRLVG